VHIVLGIVGAAVASALFSFIGIHFAGWIGYLIAGFYRSVHPNRDWPGFSAKQARLASPLPRIGGRHNAARR